MSYARKKELLKKALGSGVVGERAQIGKFAPQNPKREYINKLSEMKDANTQGTFLICGEGERGVIFKLGSD